MKNALNEEELKNCSSEFRTRVEAIRAEKTRVESSLKINPEVLGANIHELFA